MVERADCVCAEKGIDVKDKIDVSTRRKNSLLGRFPKVPLIWQSGQYTAFSTIPVNLREMAGEKPKL